MLSVAGACVCVYAHKCDLWADTVSAWCSCLVKRPEKEEAPTVATQSVNLHYRLSSHVNLQSASTEYLSRDAPH